MAEDQPEPSSPMAELSSVDENTLGLDSEGENSEDDKPAPSRPVTENTVLVSRRTSYMDITVFTKDSGTCAPEDLVDEIREAEMFLRSLPEVSYPVVKTNMRGRRQNRIVKLDWEGISNIKKKTVVTKKHSYSDVTRVGLRDTNSFVISYSNDHDFHYSSPSAVEIVQQISSRLSIRQQTDKKMKNIGTAFDNSEFQENLLEKLNFSEMDSGPAEAKTSVKFDNMTIEEGEEEEEESPKNEKSNAGAALNLMSSSPFIGMDSSPLDTAVQSTGSEGEPSEKPSSPRSPQESPVQKSPITRRKSVKSVRITNNKDLSAFKLYKLTGATEGQRLDVAVDRIIFDSNSPEGRTIQHYINNFSIVEKNPQTAPDNVRQFIDGMRDYIMTNRHEELSRLLIQAPTDGSQPDALSLTRTIGLGLEKAIIVPLYERLVKCLASKSKESEEQLKKKIEILQHKDQAYFGIPEKHISQRNWSQSCLELGYMNTRITPTEKLSAILASARAVYNMHNHEKNIGKAPEERKKFILAADDFLPIHIYIVTHSILEYPMLTTEFLWALGDPQYLSGEGGYYLTVLVSALTYILNLEIPEEDMVTVPKMKTKRKSVLGLALSKKKDGKDSSSGKRGSTMPARALSPQETISSPKSPKEAWSEKAVDVLSLSKESVGSENSNVQNGDKLCDSSTAKSEVASEPGPEELDADADILKSSAEPES